MIVYKLKKWLVRRNHFTIFEYLILYNDSNLYLVHKVHKLTVLIIL